MFFFFKLVSVIYLFKARNIFRMRTDHLCLFGKPIFDILCHASPDRLSLRERLPSMSKKEAVESMHGKQLVVTLLLKENLIKHLQWPPGQDQPFLD